MENKRSGLTLIEVIVSMLILSILVIIFITSFGKAFIITSKGKNITYDTFDFQRIMENKLVDEKENFIANPTGKDYDVEIFKSMEEYKATVDIKEVKTIMKGSREYIAYVTNYEIKKPKSPAIDLDSVGVYDNTGKKVFPWYVESNVMKATYKLKNDPIIYENRTRWYQSNAGNDNPNFPSGYNIIEENIKKEPTTGTYIKKINLSNIDVLSKSFYYFEVMAYTLAGKVAEFRNEDRILILDRQGSQEWQDYFESIYFGKEKVVFFDRQDKKIYAEIFQNPDRPTLNIDWAEPTNPQGALVGMKVPDIYNKKFETTIRFKIDEITSNNVKKDLGIGIGLVDDNNSGVIIDIDPTNNSISVNFLVNGLYKNINNSILNTKLSENSFDWTKELIITLEYGIDEISFDLEQESEEEKVNVGFGPFDIKESNIRPKYIGLKSYSDTNYKPDDSYEIVSKYDRNYSSHFYDIEFDYIEDDEEADDNSWHDGGKLGFYTGNNKNIKSNKKEKLKIKMDNKDSIVNGNRILKAKSFWFTEKTKLNLHSNILTLSVEELIRFDPELTFKSGFIKAEGITKDSYPIKIYFNEFQIIKLNNITVSNGKYIQLNSGEATIRDSNGSINITGDVSIIN